MQQDERDQEVCRMALHWIGLGYKEFNCWALCEAISIPDDQDIIDKEHLVEPEWVSRSCSSLVRLAEHGSQRPHFQLAHFTVKEYLRSIKPQSKRSLFRFSEPVAIRNLMRTSLRFLTFPIFDRKPMVASSEQQRIAARNEQHPFYPVAAAYIFCSTGEYWTESVEHGEEFSLLLEDDTMMQYASKLFRPEKTGIFLSWVLQAVWSWPNADLDELDFLDIIGLLTAPEFSSLHVAAILALPPICAHLVDSSHVDLNVCCRVGTPLHALLAGPDLLAPKHEFRYAPDVHFRSRPKVGAAIHSQTRRCLEVFLQHGADTSICWDTTSIFQMAIDSSAQTECEWIRLLIVPSTIITEDCIKGFRHHLASHAIDNSILDAIVTLGSTTEIASGWTRLATLIQGWRIQEENYEGASPSFDLHARISDKDFADGIRISLSQDLTDSLEVFVHDSRFRPEMYMIDNHSDSIPILHFAILEGSLKSVELLLEAGCDPKVVDKSNGWTPLHESSFNDTEDAAITALLLKSGASDLVQTKDGKTCWHFAAECGNIPVLKVLIDMGSDTKQSLTTTSSTGRTPLASAIYEEELESALMLLDHCGAELVFFQSDNPLLGGAAAIGSKELFLRLYDKLNEANATEEIYSSKPFESINMSCSPEFVDFLLGSWAASKNGNPNALTTLLLNANEDVFQDQSMCPSRTDLDHIIRGLLPPDHVFVDHEKRQTHYWETFCEKVVPYFTDVCNHEDSECRTGLISMIFEILIGTGMLLSYEHTTHLPSYKVFFRGLLDRDGDLNCSWIASSVHEVIKVQSPSGDLSREALSIELLSQAVRESNDELAQELLDHGVDVHAAHISLSPLEQGCYESDLPMFRMLIEHSDKTLINRTGSQGKTLLHWAVSGYAAGYLEKIQRLVQLGVNINSVTDDPNQDTALTLASRNYRRDIVALLVSSGADSMYHAQDGWTVLHAAASTGDCRYIQHLIPSETPMSFWLGVCDYHRIHSDTKSCLIKDTEPCLLENTNAIHLAARYGHSRFLMYLVQSKVPLNVDEVTGFLRLTPLHLAALYGHLEVVETLILSRANVNERNAEGRLPIDLAAQNGHLEIFKTLLKYGSNRPSKSVGDLVASLMAKETDCLGNVENSKAMFQFHFENAILHGNLDLCKELVERGQSINAELLTGSYTPLLRAVVEGQTAIVDWLVSLGVEITTPTFEWLHPHLRSIAALCTHHIQSAHTLAAILGLALEQKVGWYGSSSSPLHVAIQENKMEALNVILEHIRKNDDAYWYDQRIRRICNLR